MDVLKQRCRRCNNIHPVRTTCGNCISLRRAEAVAKAVPQESRRTYTTPWLTIRADPNMLRDTVMLVGADGSTVTARRVGTGLYGAPIPAAAKPVVIDKVVKAFHDGQLDAMEKWCRDMGIPVR